MHGIAVGEREFDIVEKTSRGPDVFLQRSVLRLQTIVSREIAPTEAAVVTFGSLQAGTKENVIPDEAIIKLNVRTFDEGTLRRSFHRSRFHRK